MSDAIAKYEGNCRKIVDQFIRRDIAFPDCVAALAAELAAAVADRLGDAPEAAGDPLGFVCRRPAEVVADPGWFEVRFPAGGASTAVRRAALDLDPGFVPWLGVVVKFVYA